MFFYFAEPFSPTEYLNQYFQFFLVCLALTSACFSTRAIPKSSLTNGRSLRQEVMEQFGRYYTIGYLDKHFFILIVLLMALQAREKKTSLHCAVKVIDYEEVFPSLFASKTLFS